MYGYPPFPYGYPPQMPYVPSYNAAPRQKHSKKHMQHYPHESIVERVRRNKREITDLENEIKGVKPPDKKSIFGRQFSLLELIGMLSLLAWPTAMLYTQLMKAFLLNVHEIIK